MTVRFNVIFYVRLGQKLGRHTDKQIKQKNVFHYITEIEKEKSLLYKQAQASVSGILHSCLNIAL